MKDALLLLISLGLVQADAQFLGFGGPIAALVYESGSRGIRPVLGVPGGSYLGRSTATELDWAWVSPNGKRAFGAQAGQLHLIREPAQEPMKEELGLTVPTLLSWSADSSAAALFWKDQNVIRRVRFFDGAMRIEDPVDLGMLPGETVGLAVSRFAGTILVSVKGLDSGGLYLLGRIGSPRLLLPLNDPTTPVLTNSERDLVIADRSTSEIHVLQRFAYRLNDTIIAVEPAESASWMGVTVSPDGRRIFLIDRADRSVTILDRLSGLPSSTIRLSFEPASMERASQQGLYLLRPVEDSVPLHLLVSNGEPAIYFIPNDNSSYTKD